MSVSTVCENNSYIPSFSAWSNLVEILHTVVLWGIERSISGEVVQMMRNPLVIYVGGDLISPYLSSKTQKQNCCGNMYLISRADKHFTVLG